ncbi:hypothetical protein [Actinacidiphila oryziradicis]|uniref:hypothetical protein n=1 Tax=Actinacidiphila oryziradicis TaxID=2571141 RepID=UPI0023F4D00B|nr:hypothetical protein [Actinacidiphila oryziradicis]MCW2869944.1 hypothetical protein [Actinacidiphila oryziradicis]
MTDGDTESPVPGHRTKYARVERERRFLLAGMPAGAEAVGVRRIIDHYLTGTRLRLRRTTDVRSRACEYKLTQKVPAELPGPVQGLVTNMYLSRAEYELFASLPGAGLAKLRYSIPPFGVDVFAPPLNGLVLAEAEFGTGEEMRAFVPGIDVVAEVTTDRRFTGGRLVRTDRSELLSWLEGHGVEI